MPNLLVPIDALDLDLTEFVETVRRREAEEGEGEREAASSIERSRELKKVLDAHYEKVCKVVEGKNTERVRVCGGVAVIGVTNPKAVLENANRRREQREKLAVKPKRRPVKQLSEPTVPFPSQTGELPDIPQPPAKDTHPPPPQDLWYDFDFLDALPVTPPPTPPAISTPEWDSRVATCGGRLYPVKARQVKVRRVKVGKRDPREAVRRAREWVAMRNT